jgi:hypothetical protein
MNLKFALAAALFISSGTFVAQAQQKATNAKTTVSLSAVKAFEKKINTFKNATDVNSSAANFETLKTEMINGISTSKAAMVSAASDAERNTITEQMNARISASNTAIQLFNTNPNNKAAIVEALNQYAKTL